MKPLKIYVPICRTIAKEQFCNDHPHPFFLYSVVRGGNLKPADLSLGLTLDRLVLEDSCKKALASPPEDWYVVFEVTPKGRGAKKASLGCSESCDIVLNDASISRRHAWIEKGSDGYYIEDAGSTAGTAVGKELLAPDARAKLTAGQRVSLGNVDLVFQPPGEFYDFVHLIAGSPAH